MSVPAVTAPYLAAVLLLGAAGVAKAVRPADTANALRAAGLPSRRRLVQAGAGAEVAISALALAWPGPLTGGLVALSYLAFAGFVATALRRGWPIASCGCFGRDDTRPNRTHVVMNLSAAGCAIWWAVVAAPGLGRAFAAQPWHGGPLSAATLLLTYLAYLVFTNPLAAARHRTSGSVGTIQ